jgi:hypothetical protein
MTTLNKLHAPALLYNSQHASPYPVVAANVSSGAAMPDSVVGILSIGGVERARGRWAGTGWGSGVTQRISLGFDAASAATLSTGIHSFTLEVATWCGATRMPTNATGELAIVNRSTSAFGAGWWLAGLESITFLPDNNMLWVGGDGSVRHYRRVSTTAWEGPRVDRVGSLRFNGTHMVRMLPGGGSIRFDSQGRHIATVMSTVWGTRQTSSTPPDGSLGSRSRRPRAARHTMSSPTRTTSSAPSPRQGWSTGAPPPSGTTAHVWTRSAIRTTRR